MEFTSQPEMTSHATAVGHKTGKYRGNRSFSNREFSVTLIDLKNKIQVCHFVLCEFSDQFCSLTSKTGSE